MEKWQADLLTEGQEVELHIVPVSLPSKAPESDSQDGQKKPSQTPTGGLLTTGGVVRAVVKKVGERHLVVHLPDSIDVPFANLEKVTPARRRREGLEEISPSVTILHGLEDVALERER